MLNNNGEARFLRTALFDVLDEHSVPDVVPVWKRHRAYAVTGKTSRRWRTPSSRRRVDGVEVDVHLAAYKGFPRCLEHLIDHGADVNAPSPNGKAYGTLYMACRGVQDYLHKIHGKPPPPENALRRWLYTFVTKPDDDALKKRWCPVYEVLFRAGAEVRPDWRDDPYAFMVDEFRGPICGFTEGPGEL